MQAVVSNFTDTSSIQASHIHNGAAGVNAGVFVDTRADDRQRHLPAELELALSTSSRSRITQLQAQAVMDNPAGNYFNMHTPLNPGGAIRGQLTQGQITEC